MPELIEGTVLPKVKSADINAAALNPSVVPGKPVSER